MNIFVTGGAGYIGSAAAAELLAAGHAVTVFDNRSRGQRAAVPSGACFAPGDLADLVSAHLLALIYKLGNGAGCWCARRRKRPAG